MSTTPRFSLSAEHFRILVLLVILVCLFAFTAASNPRFLMAQSIRDLLASLAIVLLVTIGQSMVIITRGIDLSVGAVVGLSAYLSAELVRAVPSWPPLLTLAVGISVGAACGLLNGTLVRLGGIPPLVVTLGTMYVFRGATYFISGGQRIPATELPRGFLDFGSSQFLGVPTITLIAVIGAVAGAVFLGRFRPGRDLYAIGSNPAAAELVGIPMTARLLMAYISSGVLAGIGGTLYAARFGTVDPNAGTGLELTVIASAVVGGIAIFGGSGSLVGAAAGAVLLTLVSSALPVLNVNPFWQQAIVGALILFAITADRLLTFYRATKEGRTHG